MEEEAFAICMASLLVIAMFCTILFKKLKMPAIVGYLATGIILANYVQDMNNETMHIVISILSDLGLALLMFAIGMELNFEKLKKSGAFAVLVVLVQVPIVLISGILFGRLLGWDFTLSIAMGAILAGSSTAVVIVVQREKKVLDQEAVDTLLLILVVEDVAQVIMMSVLTPMMESASSSLDVTGVAILLAEIIAFMIVSTLIGIRIVPRCLNWIGDHMDREILIISALAFCFLLSVLAIEIGMSMAVGAFLMGVIVSQSRHVETVFHSVEPMKDIFMGMFFISIGLEVNPSDLIDNLGLMIGIFLLFVISRAIAIYFGYFLGNKESRLGFISATSLLTMGEFAFIISSMAYTAGVMDAGVHAAVIGAALISMVAQSFITGSAGKVFDGITSHMPSPFSRLFGGMTNLRNNIYAKMNTMSQNGLVRIRRLATFAYCSGFAIILIVVAFHYFGSGMISQLENIESIGEETAIRVVNIMEFLLLLLPTSFLVVNLKKVLRYLTDPEERAKGFTLADSQENLINRAYSINLWIPTFILTFAIMMLAPEHVSIAEQAITSAIGIAVFLVFGYIKFRRSGKTVPEDES